MLLDSTAVVQLRVTTRFVVGAVAAVAAVAATGTPTARLTALYTGYDQAKKCTLKPEKRADASTRWTDRTGSVTKFHRGSIDCGGLLTRAGPTPQRSFFLRSTSLCRGSIAGTQFAFALKHITAKRTLIPDQGIIFWMLHMMTTNQHGTSETMSIEEKMWFDLL